MRSRKVFKLISFLIIVVMLLGFFPVGAIETSNPVGVFYQGHVEKIGWMGWVSDGATAGTTGRALRMEAININLVNAPIGARISYQAHVQKIGWQEAVTNGDTSGTTGRALRMEAVKISLIDMPGYTIQYRAHVEKIGWMDWVSDGAIAGTTGRALRMEAIQIRIVPIPVSSITVTGAGDATTITTYNGTLQMIADVQPITAKIKAVTWSVEAGTGTASIDASGLLTASTNGTVTVTATANDGSGVTGTKIITISGQPVTPPAPMVTNDDVANTVSGMTTAMEYDLDGAGYVAYDAITFAALDFSGEHTLLVRFAAEEINPAGPATTLTFTTNPVTPPAPMVTNNDVANTVSGMTTGMEYNLDGAGYVAYDAITFVALDFSGEHTLLVRFAAEGINPAGPATTLTFTTNPGPPVTNNDVTDQVFGMTSAMEYNYDGIGYVLYDQFDIAFASLNFEGDHTLLVRYAANPTGPVTTLIFTTRPGPAVTNDDVVNTVNGMTTAMEYNLDGVGYVAYDAITFAALDFSGDHTLLVRYWADGMNWTLPSKDTILTFTMNPGPPVTNDDVANTVSGMTTAMEYNLDGAGYVAYDAITFAALDFSGEHILLVRIAAEGMNPAGPAATLIFTTNPVSPPAPMVTNDDDANTVTGMEVGMEFNYDGTGYVMYDPFDIAWASLDFTGEHTLLVRYAAVGTTPASLVTTLTFTTNPPRPGPPVTNDDVANTVSGMTTEMEYSYDGAAYVMYDDFFGPDEAFNALDFTGNHILLVRYAEDPMNGWPPSLDTTLTFTTNPA